ncbi:YIP1 family protein [Nocardiopsis sp. MG754419]|uniref:YIP1 family protein n=1 Tax=Nocardiopsis sp. MG754419 TaxID=2259865 RepID=UPI001BAA72C8|nr:YIP1 family protein [Nocardiopsis sp. MG754419]MBR8741732.1 YIP1 family protein [Nocardiopsis sp. MG754419]
MLRHLVGLLAGVALAPVLWVGIAWSAEEFPRATQGEVDVASVSSVVVLCLVGAVGAYLVASRRSPLVAGAAGLLLAALCLWPILAPESLAVGLSALNEESFLYPDGNGLGVALPLGVLLLGSATLPARWRAAEDLGPLPRGRVVASVDRDGYRSAPAEEPPPMAEQGPGEPVARPWNDGGPVGDTIPEVPPPSSPRREYDDPNKTTTPFHRGEGGAVWTPVDDEPGHTRAYDERGR